MAQRADTVALAISALAAAVSIACAFTRAGADAGACTAPEPAAVRADAEPAAVAAAEPLDAP